MAARVCGWARNACQKLAGIPVETTRRRQSWTVLRAAGPGDRGLVLGGGRTAGGARPARLRGAAAACRRSADALRCGTGHANGPRRPFPPRGRIIAGVGDETVQRGTGRRCRRAHHQRLHRAARRTRNDRHGWSGKVRAGVPRHDVPPRVSVSRERPQERGSRTGGFRTGAVGAERPGARHPRPVTLPTRRNRLHEGRCPTPDLRRPRHSGGSTEKRSGDDPALGQRREV